MTGKVRTVGILGGGQLAAMLTDAAHRLGIEVHVYRESGSSGRCTADRVTTRPFDDLAALEAFAAEVDVVTVETENIPLTTLRAVERVAPVLPSPEVVAITQDRLLEKEFLTANGIASAPYAPVGSEDDLRAALARLGGRGLLKTRRFGYDGKGQTKVAEGDDAVVAWRDHGEAPSIVEGLVEFDCEMSVVAARDEAGEIAVYDPGLNAHRDGILRRTTIPSLLEPEIERQARRIARHLLDAHAYVGVMAVELFVVGSELLVNETAPRVHNSGHWTQVGCAVDQFEQHIRAIAGRPLGSTARHCDVVMTNLIGHDVDELDALLHEANTRVHLYGKPETRPGRKMGHVNRVSPLT